MEPLEYGLLIFIAIVAIISAIGFYISNKDKE